MLSKKLISYISLALMCIMLCTTLPAAANTEVPYVYSTVDLSAVANAKFYVGDNETEKSASYARNDFLCGDTYPASFYAAKWPLSLNVREENSAFPAQAASIEYDSSDNAILTSEKSGILYTLPTKQDEPSANEALLLEARAGRGPGNYAWGTVGSADVTLTGNYDGVSFLVAVACTNTQNMAITATATYSDGGTDSVTETIPGASAAQQSGSENFIADLSWLACKLPNHSAGNNPTAFTNDLASAGTIAVYEYSLTLDPEKELEKITFTQTQSGGTRGLMVLAMTAIADWSGKVAEAEEAIDAAVDDSGNVDKVLAAVDSVNNIKKAGIDVDTHISNIAEYNALFEGAAFGDVLLGSVFGNTTADWDNTETLLSQSESIVAAIEATGNSYEDLAEETRAILEAAYADMVDVLLESDAETEVLKERFALLKDTKIDALSDIFREMVIWTESFGKTAEPDLVTFDLDFSQPIAEDKLNADYISVKFGDDEINPTLITYEAKLTDSDIMGATIKIINSLDYSKAYTITVDEALTGANGGEWAYPCVYTETVTAPFAVDSSEISVTDNTVSGSLALTNNTGVSKPYVVLIAAYSDDNKMLASKPIQGTMAPGVSPANVEFTAPDGTAEIYCYVLGDYTDLSLLSAFFKLK